MARATTDQTINSQDIVDGVPCVSTSLLRHLEEYYNLILEDKYIPLTKEGSTTNARRP